MSKCNWDPSKHGGKSCPVHGAGGNAGTGGHRIRINGGKYEMKLSDDSDWEEISSEEYNDLREGGYQEFDETVDDDFGFDEDDKAGSLLDEIEDANTEEEKKELENKIRTAFADNEISEQEEQILLDKLFEEDDDTELEKETQERKLAGAIKNSGKGEWLENSFGDVVYGQNGEPNGFITKTKDGKYVPNYTYGGKWRNEDTGNLKTFDNLDEAKAFVEKGLNRFSKRPSQEDYGIDKDLKTQLGNFEHYHAVENPDEEIDSIKKWRDKAVGQSYADEEYLGKFDRDIALLSNPKIRKYIEDRNSFDKQFENDFEEFKEEAKQKYLEKILGDNDLYNYDYRDDFSKDKDDLFDEINDTFAKRYGYERTKYGDMFSPLRDKSRFGNYYGDGESINDANGRYRKRRYNKDKVIGDLLGTGVITFADLKKFLKGK